MLLGGPDRRTLHLLTASGDSSIASTTAYAQLCESLDHTLQPEPEALLLRGIAAELERLANHVGDLGALAGDVAFLSTAAFCGRLRGEFLNMTAEICGNRFGRYLVCPGGVNMAFTPAQARKVLTWLQRVMSDVDNALELLFESATVLDRFEGTGTVSTAAARELGLVGGRPRLWVNLDLRHTHPYGCYTLRTCSGRRLRRRWWPSLGAPPEIAASAAWLREQLAGWQKNRRHRSTRAWPPTCAVSLAGREVPCRHHRCRRNFPLLIVDPSFHNWFDWQCRCAGRFPYLQQSFNLSYCGHDL